MADFAERLKQLRGELGLNQPNFAKHLGGRSKSTILRWENGEIIPPQPVVDEIAEILGVSSGYLLGYADERDAVPDDGSLSSVDQLFVAFHRMKVSIQAFEDAMRRFRDTERGD